MALSQRAQQLRSLTDFALWTALRATAAENWLYATSPAITLHSGIDRRPLSSALLPTDKPKHLSGLLRTSRQNDAPHNQRHAQSKAEQYNVIEEEQGLVRIDGEGFIVNGDQYVFGPVVCLRESYLSYKVSNLSQVNLDALSFLDILRPRPELILIGTGSTLQQLHPDLQKGLHAKGLSFEALDTPNAIATFNILNQEARKVAGVFFPTTVGS